MKKILALFFLCFLQFSSYAITFTVTNCASSPLVNGSLPWAVEQANSSGTNVVINFNISTTETGYVTEGGVSFWRIELASPLSLSYDGIFINGSSQKENQGDSNLSGPEIEITAASGSNMESLIKIHAVNNCTIEGLAINGSPGYGVFISYGNYNRLSGNYIGTTVSGEAAKPNISDGIYIEGADHNTIGGIISSEGNLISGNGRYGVYLNLSTYNNVFLNKIGVSSNESGSIKNTRSGIYLYNQSRYQTIRSNVIAFNGTASYPYGVLLDGTETRDNFISQNKSFSNYGAGIKLLNYANRSIVPPTIASVEVYPVSNRTYLFGTSEGNAYIEIFQSVTDETDAAGEGKIFIGSTEADLLGNWLMSISGTYEGEITATQTDGNFNTSQFAVKLSVVSSGVEHRPDGEIALILGGADYVGSGIINASGLNQTKTKNIYYGQTASFYIKAKNQGTTDEAFVVYGTKSDASWEVTYYSATAEGINITSSVTLDGWQTAVLATAEEITFRVEAKSLTSETSTKNLYITIVSSNDAVKKDVVAAVANSRVSPDTFDHFTFDYPSTTEAAASFLLTIEARNVLGDITTEVNSQTNLSVDYGTILPSSIESSQFSDDGIWSGNITLSKAGKRKITALAVDATGSFEITVYNAEKEFSEDSLDVSVRVPSGLTSDEVSISISEINSLPGSSPSNKWQAGKIIELTANVDNFQKPLTVTLPLYPGAKSPEVYYWTDSSWSQDGLTKETVTSSSITFSTMHLTVFVPFGDASTNQFTFGPSPYNPERDNTAYFWYWLNADSATSIYVVNISGGLIYKREFIAGVNGGQGGLNQIAWEGRDHYGRMLENGVYLYKIVQGLNVIAKGKFIVLR
ncbi:hypothetical protein A3J90_03430 [candidate division WOR-1 bacterium RIFOXYC2_FULL_37_10]|uniref:Periplasmic copper-binding protein NosD beta helix domain-containing protein n=1 Tax=candidate division WOR-1 bacterium RIFOXYB2_FULL_37_13 TaxID=1802579 RepID=A0A1F4SVE6_UNCSA|nr:MAG: hypothetical protein A2310_08385 [candidate division WOR-1 bacterium RIFOXYB2_FULL_37_13]OGC37492.1 MAG: hypothetical protein A3J90_03430 [candidate division WOR-1 bacterium RIFOXYC2_FULL_37_10]